MQHKNTFKCNIIMLCTLYKNQSLIIENHKRAVIENVDKPFHPYVRYITKYVYCRNIKYDILR